MKNVADQNLDAIRLAAKAGDAAAQTALGKRLLVGHGVPLSPNEGAAMLAAAAQAGSGEAAEQIAVLIAAGAMAPEQWSMAFDYLQQAAEQGWVPAQSQLALLASDREAAARAVDNPPPQLWSVLRRSVVLRNWTQSPPLHSVGEAPFARISEVFLSSAACDWMIARARGRVAQAQIYDQATGVGRIDPSRSNSAFSFNVVDTDLVLLLIRARIAAACGYPVQLLEETNVLHYAVGQQFNRHFDFLDPAVSGYAAEIAQKGQRVATFLIYLNDGFEGAETDFPAVGWRCRPAKGGALFFTNVDAAGNPDRRTLHAGLAPRAGEKWLLSQWIRQPLR